MLTKSENRKLIKSIENVEDKINGIAGSTKIKIISIAVGILFALGVILFAFIAIYEFADTYKVKKQSMIHFEFSVRFPLYLEKRVNQDKVISPLPKVAPSPKLKSEREIINSTAHSETLWRIYGLETSWGKNDYCRVNNKGFGGFGVMDGKTIVCYPTFEKAVERAEYWLVKNGIDNNLPLALCKWNIGLEIENCDYYQNYLALN